MPNAKFMTINIKDFYLLTPMDHYKYFRMKLKLFPQDIIGEYALREKWMRMAMFYAKCDGECTASHRPASLHKTSSPNAFTKQVTNRAPSHQDTGGIIDAPSASPSLSKFLA
jgi:hypothetical protein